MWVLGKFFIEIHIQVCILLLHPSILYFTSCFLSLLVIQKMTDNTNPKSLVFELGSVGFYYKLTNLKCIVTNLF